jgi:hypothetical protein
MKKADIFRLSDGLLSFVTYEWVTVPLFLGTRTSYHTSSAGKLPLQINASVDQSENCIIDTGQPTTNQTFGSLREDLSIILGSTRINMIRARSCDILSGVGRFSV